MSNRKTEAFADGSACVMDRTCRYTLLPGSQTCGRKGRVDSAHPLRRIWTRCFRVVAQLGCAAAVASVGAVLSIVPLALNARQGAPSGATQGTSRSGNTSTASIAASKIARAEQHDWPVYGGSR